MRTKLLLTLLVFAMTNIILAQPEEGDYQTAGAGPADWHTASSWQVWDGNEWVIATDYPGQIDGTYNVEIRTGHVITMQSDIDNLPNTFGTLTINGEIRIFNNQNVYINATATIVTTGVGTINFVQNANLYFPANMAFSVFPGGLLPADESNACNASKRIFIGTILFSSCNGNGPGDPISFWELMEANGNLISVITVAFSDCNAATYNATLTPSFLGLEGSDTTFTWTIIDPNEVSSDFDNEEELIIDLNIEGEYQFDLKYTTSYQGQDYTNTRTILYENKLTTWNGVWTKGFPTEETRVIIATSYSGDSFSCCFLKVNNGATLTINTDNYVEVEGSIINEGTIVIEDDGSLVQKDNAATFTGTNNTLTRTSRPMKALDYVYWGSPVEEAIDLTDAPISDYFDRFYSWNLTGAPTGTWAQLTQSPPVGHGFIARVRSSQFPLDSPANTTTTTQFEFNGKFNTGPISVFANIYDGGDVSVNSGNSILLANPYPSAIDANILLTEYPQIVKLLFWTSVTVYLGIGEYQVTDYATFNLTGSTTSAPTTVGANIDGLTPEGYIASGQGFFAQVDTDVNIIFNNNMRVRDSNTQFFRTAEPETLSTKITENEKNRLWLNISNNTNAYRQMLIGYIEGATNGYESNYDATSFTTNEIDIYTILENKELAIQGRALPFNNSDIIPLGYRVTNSGIYSITLSDMDGLFTEYEEIFLKDKATNIYHNLKKGSYEFNAQTGTFNNRFEIHFRKQAMETNPIANENNLVIFGTNKTLNVNSYESNIQTVEVFDLVGKRIFSANDINVERYVSPSIHAASPLLIARVTLANNQVTTKKVLIK